MPYYLVYFNIPLLIMYLSAIEILICYTEIEVNKVYFLRFCTQYDTSFSKYSIELIVALSSTNATKIMNHILCKTEETRSD